MYRKNSVILVLALVGLLSYTLVPGAAADSKPLPEPIAPPDFVEHDEQMEPEVTIIQREDATVEEYRVNGRLYMVKITPFIGKPYYFIDRDGDGLMESRMSDLYNPFQVPQWVIFSW
ncbi:MAG TPA: DUF2782 domain-containing protein [Gammaproteobacteria bacterium]|nr:DUF2782 domain-containing protein [Gammaproteobacteria bacterium]|tara:strand:- start:1194 stop:1544 length:351 start_codon:yes stop_codon:yes gene_type:complete